MPRALGTRLVAVEREVDRLLGLLQAAREVQVRRRVVDGVAAKHDERRDLAGREGSAQLRERLATKRPIRHVAVHHRLAGVAEAIVEHRDERMHRRGLVRPGDDERTPAMVGEVLRRRVEHLEVLRREARGRRGGRHRRDRLLERGVADLDARSLGEHRRDRREIRASHRHAIVGIRAHEAQAGLERVEARDLLLLRVGVLDAPTPREVAGPLEARGLVAEEVRAERDDDLRLIEPVLRSKRAAEGHRQARPLGVVVDRLPLAPDRLGESRHEALLRVAHRRPGERFREHREAFAAAAGKAAETLGRERLELREAIRADGLALPHREARTGRVVELEHRRLRERVAGALIERMVGVALDLERAAIEALDEQAARDAAQLHRGRVVDRDAGRAVRRTRRVGNDRRLGHAAARRKAHTREGEGRAHHPQELPAVVALEAIGAFGELALHVLTELGRVRAVFEAAPVGPALSHRHRSAVGGLASGAAFGVLRRRGIHR